MAGSMRVGGCTLRRLRLWSLGIAAFAAVTGFPTTALASPACVIRDSFRSFITVAESTAGQPTQQQIWTVRDDYLGRNTEIYVSRVVPVPSDASLLKAMEAVRAHPEWRLLDATLGPAVGRVAARFAHKFPDFRCDFPVYVTETFGVMDGAARLVGGRPALVLGVSMIAQFETLASLPVFLSHELFHRYHFQAAGFSDDLDDRDMIWRALWAEGLATYVSAQLNPSRPLSDALAFPTDLEARAQPFVPQMATELLAAADRVDSAVFAKFFGAGSAEAKSLGWPPRSGYYVGYLVARDLGRRHKLSELAHLQGAPLRAEIGRSLEGLAHSERP